MQVLTRNFSFIGAPKGIDFNEVSFSLQIEIRHSNLV